MDNNFRGHKVALWILAPIALMKLPLALYAIFAGRYLAQTADAIPLDTFTSAGESTLLAFLTLWGFFQLLFAAAIGLSMMRYRALIPLIYVVLLVEYLAKKWILMTHPIATARTFPPLSATFFLLPTRSGLVMVILIIVGLVFSLLGPSRAKQEVSPSH